MTIPAVVTILDLATAAAASTGMWLEASFTTGSVATTNRVSLQQIMSTNLGALPTGGATGQLLTKSSGSDFATQWSSISSLVTVNATSGLQLSGSTTIALALASVAGLSVLGTNTTGTTIPLPITAVTGAQVLRANDAGTGVAFGAVNLASAAAVTGVLPGANQSATNLATTGAGGVQGVLPIPNGGSGMATFSINAVVLGGTTATSPFQTVTGTSGFFLQSQGTNVAPAYAQINLGSTANLTGILTVPFGGVGIANYTIGDIIYASATTTLSKLAAGTTGYLLQTRGTSTSPQWVGGAVLLNTITPSGVATAGDTTSLTSTYRSYLVIMDNVLPATNTNTLQMQLSTNAGGAFIAANYVNSTSSTTVLDLTGGDVSTSAGGGVCGEIRLFNPSGTGAFKAVRGNSTYVNNAGTAAGQGAAGLWIGTATVAVNAFQVKFASGNIATGTIKVYGFI